MSTQQTDALQCAADLEYSIARHGMQDAFTLNAYRAMKMVRTQQARITELESQLAQRFDAADMATAAAQGFRDGVASVAHQPITDTNTASGAADKVLAYLDDLSDDAAAHIFPSDLAKCMTSECVVEVVSVRAGNPNERTVPLFSREQVVAALASTPAQAGVPAKSAAYAALPEPLEIDWPELHSQALGCGVEDRGLHNRYECAEYGWQDGVDKCAERVPEQIFDADQMLAFADATHMLRASHGQAPAGANENAELVTLIAECRDAFPIPAHGDPIENYWSAAIEDPANVPAYLQEIAKRKQADSVQEDAAWMPLTPELLTAIESGDLGNRFWIAAHNNNEPQIGVYEWRQGRNPHGFNSDLGRYGASEITHVLPYKPPALPAASSPQARSKP